MKCPLRTGVWLCGWGGCLHYSHRWYSCVNKKYKNK